MDSSRHKQVVVVVLIGLTGLASAMGIGRFAFTPILPLMQHAGQLNLIEGSWLASINYLGYFIGALSCIWLTPYPARWASMGLLTVALSTLAMAVPGQGMALWLLWRLLAGIASAFVLVGLSTWCLEKLVHLRAGKLSGIFYAGVGVGVMVAGLAGLGAGVMTLHPNVLWACLGLLALAVWNFSYRHLVPLETDTRKKAVIGKVSFTADHWRLILCYGIFGIGYILPATFLPAMARERLPNPAVFGWVWPIFGMAAAISTLVVARFFHAVLPRLVWAGAAFIMAVGVALPMVSTGLFVLLISALCVGGTFMVITQAGMQEAKTIGGATLIAAMTSGFAAGQILGPALLNLSHGALLWPSLLGASLLLASTFILVHNRGQATA